MTERDPKRTSRALRLTVLTLSVWALVVPAADAYVDPGSGSFIVQLLVGGVMAAGLSVKVFWRRIRSVFSRGSSSRDEA